MSAGEAGPSPKTVFFYNHTGSVSGAEIVLLALLRDLDRTQFQPLVICPEGELAAQVKALGVPHRPMRVVTARFSKNVFTTFGYFGELIGVVREFRRFLRRERPALLHANSIRAGLVASGAGRGLGFPVLWHLHDILPKHPFSTVIRRFADASGCTRLLAVSKATATGFQMDDGKHVVKKNVAVIYNSVDLNRFQPDSAARSRIRQELGLADDDVAVGTIAQITPRKRQVDMVQAFAAVRQSLPQVKLFLVGAAQFHAKNQEYAARLQQVVAETGAGEQIQLLGRRSDVPAVVNAMDLMMQYPENEPLGMSLMEALACAKPCVAPGIDGIPEVVEDGVDGLLSGAHDTDALMHNLQRLATDATLRSAMGEAGRKNMQQRFSSAEQMQQMHALYSSLIADSMGSGS